MKLSKTQAALVAQIKDGGFLVDKNLGMGISSKTCCYLTKNKSIPTNSMKINPQTVDALISKGVLILAYSTHGGITHHFYKLNDDIV